MSAPHRVQLRRTKGWRKPENTIVVARPSRWGNPYLVGQVVVDPVNSLNPIAACWQHSSRTYGDLPRYVIKQAIDGSEYAQHWYVIDDRVKAVELYQRLIVFEQWDLSSLRGHNLACWCPLDQPCHADVLLELANGGAA